MKVKKKDDILTQDHINAIYYGDENKPKKVLGYHKVEEGELFCYWNPLAQLVYLKHRYTDRRYEMEQIKSGFFVCLLEDKTKIIASTNQNSSFEYQCAVVYDVEHGVKEIVENPYLFSNQIGVEERIRFGRGEHYEAYTMLGAKEQSIAIDSKTVVTGIRFAVYAPHAKRVSVLGSWNNFHPLMHPMERLDDGGIFELWIPEAKANMEYEFEIKTEFGDVFRRSDPYRTGTMKKNRRCGIILEEKEYGWHDKKYLEQRRKQQENSKKRSSIFYQVDFQLYQKQGKKNNRPMTYRQITKEVVAHVKEMGYTHVQVKGLLEHDNANGEKKDGNVIGYFSPSSLYGKSIDFKYFVDCLHRHNIGVYLDWDITAFSQSEDGLGNFDGQPEYEYEDPLLGVHADEERYRFCYGKKQVQSFLLSNLFYWIREYHVDGFSIYGIASMLYQDYGRLGGEWRRNQYGEKENLESIAFLQKLNRCIQEEDSSVQIVVEDNSRWLGLTRGKEEGGLGFQKVFQTDWLIDYLAYMSHYPTYRQYDFWKMQQHGIGYFYEPCILSTMLSDDLLENSTLIQKIPGEYFYRFANLRLIYSYMFALPGDKALFMGEDLAYWNPLERKKGMDFTRGEDVIHKCFQYYIKELIAFYKEKLMSIEEKRGQSISWLHIEEAESGIFSFVRKSKEETFLFVFHMRREASIQYELKLPHEENYELIFHSDRPEYGGIGNSMDGIVRGQNKKASSLIVDLPPLSFLVFSSKTPQ